MSDEGSYEHILFAVKDGMFRSRHIFPRVTGLSEFSTCWRCVIEPDIVIAFDNLLFSIDNRGLLIFKIGNGLL